MTPEIVLPWPDRERHPNSRTHWGRKAKLSKIARIDSAWRAKEAGWHRLAFREGRLHLWIDAYAPDRRRRDTDGVLSNLKAELDGIADALGIDDSRFVPHPYLHDEPRKGGEIRIRITQGPQP